MFTKTFDILPKIIMVHISDLGLTLPPFEFLSLYLHMFDQNLHFLHKKLRIHSRPDRNQSKLTVCTGQDQETTPTTPESSRKSTCFSRPVKKYLKIFVVRKKVGKWFYWIWSFQIFSVQKNRPGMNRQKKSLIEVKKD